MLSRQIVILLLLTVQSIFGLSVVCTAQTRLSCVERNCEINYPGTKCVSTSLCGDTKCQVIEKPQEPLTPTHQQKQRNCWDQSALRKLLNDKKPQEPLTPTHQQKTLELLESISADVNSLKLLNDNRN